MTFFSNTYADTRKDNLLAAPYARFGGPRRGRRSARAFEPNERYGGHGVHMPLDTGVHWEWSNPLNILPALVLFVFVVAVVALVLA
jgi:hypothetical protein